MKKLILFGTVATALLFVSACKKEEKKEDEAPKYDGSTAPQSNAIIENAYDEMTNMSDQAITGTMIYYKFPTVNYLTPEEYKGGMYDKGACSVVIVVDTTASPSSVTIDYGTVNCDCNDGKQRRGKIVTTFTGKYRDAGTVITHTPVDYYVNDNKIEGTKTVTNMGLNASSQPYFNIDVNGSVTMSTGEVYTYSSQRVRTWTNGSSTLGNFLDDEYDITGSATASSSLGNGYTATITSPLHVKVGCAYITSGVLEFTPTDKPVRVIDYGNGTCDNTFTVTVNGVTYTING